MSNYVCIHGHFYQPPRENPWLEAVELQDSAYPFHDWNARITAECYGPNTASRILDTKKRIVNIINNYSKMSFNFGPTLLSWMEKNDPDVYKAILEADKISMKNFSGHGSAIAQAYNHIIMPLANSKDKRTQIIWGIEDFAYRFKRHPEGMWLPETAVDIESLDIMAEMGIKFAILAPHQAFRKRKLGVKKWEKTNGSIDPKLPYLCNLPSGRTITVFFYDGPVSHDIAFSGLLKDGVTFADRLTGLFHKDGPKSQLVHIATDGETYGHHHRFGEMALTYCLHHIESNGKGKLTIYGEFLSKLAPIFEVEIVENSSWSCAHGVDRWRKDCGCAIGSGQGWTQKWREPLRNAMDFLRDALIPLFEQEMKNFTDDPWRIRNKYINIILERSITNIDKFFKENISKELSTEDKIKILKLLEMQRHAQLMYTSCGWFFDEISGIETVQIMQYAARAIQLARDINGVDWGEGYLKIIEKAPSNVKDFKNGKDIWNAYIKSSSIDLQRVGAHFGASSLFEEYIEDDINIYCYTAKREIYEKEEIGKQKLVIGKAHIVSKVTLEESLLSFAFVHLGDHNLDGGVMIDMEDDAFQKMMNAIKESFVKNDMPGTIRLIHEHFGSNNYSLWHLFRDEQRKIMNGLLEATSSEIEGFALRIYEEHYPIMQVMKELNMPLPKTLSAPLEFMFNIELKRLLEADKYDIEGLQKLAEEIDKWKFQLDKEDLGYIASQKINSLMQEIVKSPEDIMLITKLTLILQTLLVLPLKLDLSRAQNIFFDMGIKIYPGVETKSENGDDKAKEWIEVFDNLGRYLGVMID
ncbi:MAG: DUF3536 domain-containing protein [Candidatus Aureabacteria bacterium]|nr:DUF3536 domain-containing protein [Candidatus Auribacterota bacterium]